MQGGLHRCVSRPHQRARLSEAHQRGEVQRCLPAHQGDQPFPFRLRQGLLRALRAGVQQGAARCPPGHPRPEAFCGRPVRLGAASRAPQVQKTGRKAAVVGAGPAGLACAHDLALEGHDVTVYEALPEPGGMLRYAIPEYRLPKAEVEKEIGYHTKARRGDQVRRGGRQGRSPLRPSMQSTRRFFWARAPR